MRLAWTVMLSVLAGSVASMGSAAPALKEPPKKGLDIVGEWIVEAQVTNGRPVNSKIERRYTFTADGKWSIATGQAKGVVTTQRTYVLDAATTPAAIDMWLTANDQGPVFRGIVKVEGDTLTLCYSRNAMDRPTSFDSPADSQRILIVMKRKKKD